MSYSVEAQKTDNVLSKKLYKLMYTWKNPVADWKTKVDSVLVMKNQKIIKFYFSKNLSYMPIREQLVSDMNKSIEMFLPQEFKKYRFKMYSNQRELHELIPNYYRKKTLIDKTRLFYHKKKKNFIERKGQLKPANGLYGNHLALWHSHGYYYEGSLDRWEWQRARTFSTVEDMLPMSFVLPYLVPMLENAGATVFLPRERDIQNNEIIIDNDSSSYKSEFILSENIKKVKSNSGFLMKDTLFANENPFKLGSSLTISAKKDTKIASYIPYFKSSGKYAVYISYRQQKKSAIAQYLIYHTGGVSIFDVNQSMGGATWIYLGTFKFDKGKNKKTGRIDIRAKKGKISVDAIKIGGGMGNVARRIKGKDLKAKTPKRNIFKWKKSGKARYLEAARYWMQYSGIPEYVYNLNHGANDYKDDYQSRGVWVNYLNGTVRSKLKENEKHGLNLPIDLSLAFHTDAGIRKNNTIVGTLAIYSTLWEGDLFPNKKSKQSSRDLSDMVQTQIVADIRNLYNKKWTRRPMWDVEYSEAWKPNVPTMLLELLSHQNLADMQFALDPRFRFDVSRAIYKAILKFQSTQEGRPFVVQPLPVEALSIKKIGENKFQLSWKPVADKLEPSAIPKKYKIYKRINNNGFDDGIICNDTIYNFTIDKFGEILSFKVTAINEGGESMPSEILSAGVAKNAITTVLIVNAFDRICAPAIIQKENYAGIEWWNDEGVAHNKDISYTGKQFNYQKNDKWKDDDSPGWGASYGNMEGKPIQGNTFDFVYTHGAAILNAGYSFVSVSDESFVTNYNTDNYKCVDIILGEEKATQSYKDSSLYDFVIFTKQFRNKITNLTKQNTSIFISGAYIGSDLMFDTTKASIKFAKNILHYKFMTNHAVIKGDIYATDYAQNSFNGKYKFNTQYSPEIYKVEAPDAIEAIGKGAGSAFRYSENSAGAGIMYKGKYKVVALGFPFETIIKKDDRIAMMKQILKFLN